ncbi:hypothetical protein HUJ04_012503 [Dendroctonus ponderosae]|nr:hypothetical protein HUJ04_012503 [Dendroctonus ponderosae]
MARKRQTGSSTFQGDANFKHVWKSTYGLKAAQISIQYQRNTIITVCSFYKKQGCRSLKLQTHGYAPEDFY